MNSVIWNLDRHLYIICIKLTAANSFIGNFYFFSDIEIDRTRCFFKSFVFVCSGQIFDRLDEENSFETIELVSLNSNIINI